MTKSSMIISILFFTALTINIKADKGTLIVPERIDRSQNFIPDLSILESFGSNPLISNDSITQKATQPISESYTRYTKPIAASPLKRLKYSLPTNAELINWLLTLNNDPFTKTNTELVQKFRALSNKEQISFFAYAINKLEETIAQESKKDIQAKKEELLRKIKDLERTIEAEEVKRSDLYTGTINFTEQEKALFEDLSLKIKKLYSEKKIQEEKLPNLKEENKKMFSGIFTRRARAITEELNRHLRADSKHFEIHRDFTASLHEEHGIL